MKQAKYPEYMKMIKYIDENFQVERISQKISDFELY